MTDSFIQALNLSISASYLVLAVLLGRLLLKKAPKWVNMALWAIVAARLIFPFSIESVLSLLPSRQTIPPSIGTMENPGIQSGLPVVDDLLNPVIQQQFAPVPEASANPLQAWLTVAAVIWLLGMGAMLLYALISYLHLRWRVRDAVHLRRAIYRSERIPSPFVLGLLLPRVYVPYSIPEESLPYVLAHEESHIDRCDHWWKPLGFLLLSIYWFNPLLWVAYTLLSRDIELACDERAIKYRSEIFRAEYSQALLDCSIARRSIAACPLAFGEVGVKQRIQTVLNYKKPAFWAILLSILLCTALAVGFLTQPPEEEQLRGPAWVEALESWDVEAIELYAYDGGGGGYKKLSGQELNAAVALIQKCTGPRLPGTQQPDGGCILFEVLTKDGRRHTVKNMGNAVLEIDGVQIQASYEFLNSWYTQWRPLATDPIPDSQERQDQAISQAKSLTLSQISYVALYAYPQGDIVYSLLPESYFPQLVALVNAQSAAPCLGPGKFPCGPEDVGFNIYLRDGTCFQVDMGEQFWIEGFCFEWLDASAEPWLQLSRDLRRQEAQGALEALGASTESTATLVVYDPYAGRVDVPISDISGFLSRLQALPLTYIEDASPMSGLRQFYLRVGKLSLRTDSSDFLWINDRCFTCPEGSWWQELSALAGLPETPQERPAMQWLRTLDAGSIASIQAKAWDRSGKTCEKALTPQQIAVAAQHFQANYGYYQADLRGQPSQECVVFVITMVDGSTHTAIFHSDYFALDGQIFVQHLENGIPFDYSYYAYWMQELGAWA